MASYSCRDRISTRLLVHFCFTWHISIIFIIGPVTFALIIGQLVWIAKQIGSENFDIEFVINDRRYTRLFDIRRRQLMKLIFSELMLILLYVSIAFLYRLMMNNNSICWMTFARWLLEASFLPYSIGMIVTGSYLNWWEEYLLENDPKSIAILAYMSKGILFVFMRYVEMYPSSKINNYQIDILYRICG